MRAPSYLMTVLIFLEFLFSIENSQLHAEEDVGRERFGVATHFGIGWHDPALIPFIRNAGFGWIRDQIDWSNIEPEPGKYRLPVRDAVWIQKCHEAGLKICLILCGGNKNLPDQYDATHYAGAAAFLARELKGKIHALEVLNEPNASGFNTYYGGAWNGRESGGGNSIWIGKYVHLLNETAKQVKAVNPGIKVVGLGAVPPANYRMLRDGVASEVDAVVDHPYSMRSIPELIPYPATTEILERDGVTVADKSGSFRSFIEHLRAEMARSGGKKEIWLTEWGYTTFLQKEQTQHQPSTEDAQAAYAARRFLECFGLGVELSIYYNLQDNGVDPSNPEHHFGLLRRDGTPKLAYQVLKRLFAAIKGWRAENQYAVDARPSFPQSERPLRCYRFQTREGNPALALWLSERFPSDLSPMPVLIELGLKAPARVEQVEAYAPYTDKRETVPFTQEGERIRLSGLRVPAHPILLEFRCTADASGGKRNHREVRFSSTDVNCDKGDEFPGADGSVSASGGEEGDILEITYQFQRGGQYIEAKIEPIMIAEPIVKLSGEVLCPNGESLFLRLYDASGEIHQFAIQKSSDKEWRPFTIDLTGSSSSWGGDQNRSVDLPLRAMGLGVQKTGVLLNGRVLFRKLHW